MVLILYFQETKADVAFAKKIISEFEKPEHGKEPTFLSVTGMIHKSLSNGFSGFSAFIASGKYNTVFNAEHAAIYQDMNQPFTHYWIASSHNT